MTIDSAPPDSSPQVRPATPTVAPPAPPSWPWRRAALFLAGAAQLVTISALVGADPIPASWSSLLLAAAPAPVAAVAGFAPAPVNLLAALAGIVVLAVGIVAQVTHTGLFFVPALVVLAVGALGLCSEQVSAAGEGVSR